MTTKLTLTVDKTIIDKAKKYAKGTGRSLSKFIEEYLQNITDNADDEKKQMSSKLKVLYGAARIPSTLDHKKELRKMIQNKNRD